MGIKSLTKTIKTNSPQSITHENLYKLSGKRVAVDASLIIYQQLFNTPGGRVFRNSKGQITNHVTGVFYKVMNYIALDIELIFVFDGKPPENKSTCIQERKEKSMKAKELSEKTTDVKEKQKLAMSSMRVTHEMINQIKKLLDLLGVSYIHPDGEGEAYASELCRIGYVDYVLTEDMDTMVYACPRMIRNCVDSSIKRKDIVSIITYQTLIDDLHLDHNSFIDFCILCGCDYCPIIPRVGNVTALKLIHKYNTIENILENTNYKIPDNYLIQFNAAKENFLLFRDKINIDTIDIHTSLPSVNDIEKYLINDIEMNDKRVKNALKKFHNKYKHTK